LIRKGFERLYRYIEYKKVLRKMRVFFETKCLSKYFHLFQVGISITKNQRSKLQTTIFNIVKDRVKQVLNLMSEVVPKKMQEKVKNSIKKKIITRLYFLSKKTKTNLLNSIKLHNTKLLKLSLYCLADYTIKQVKIKNGLRKLNRILQKSIKHNTIARLKKYKNYMLNNDIIAKSHYGSTIKYKAFKQFVRVCKGLCILSSSQSQTARNYNNQRKLRRILTVLNKLTKDRKRACHILIEVVKVNKVKNAIKHWKRQVRELIYKVNKNDGMKSKVMKRINEYIKQLVKKVEIHLDYSLKKKAIRGLQYISCARKLKVYVLHNLYRKYRMLLLTFTYPKLMPKLSSFNSKGKELCPI